jgi:hypothetical protein
MGKTIKVSLALTLVALVVTPASAGYKTHCERIEAVPRTTGDAPRARKPAYRICTREWKEWNGDVQHGLEEPLYGSTNMVQSQKFTCRSNEECESYWGSLSNWRRIISNEIVRRWIVQRGTQLGFPRQDLEDKSAEELSTFTGEEPARHELMRVINLVKRGQGWSYPGHKPAQTAPEAVSKGDKPAQTAAASPTPAPTPTETNNKGTKEPAPNKKIGPCPPPGE